MFGTYRRDGTTWRFKVVTDDDEPDDWEFTGTLVAGALKIMMTDDDEPDWVYDFIRVVTP